MKFIHFIYKYGNRDQHRTGDGHRYRNRDEREIDMKRNVDMEAEKKVVIYTETNKTYLLSWINPTKEPCL